MVKRAAAVASAKEADETYLKARRMNDDDGAKRAKADCERYDRERDHQNEVIHELECRIEADKRTTCAEEIAAPAAELRRLMRLTADQSRACQIIAKKYGQSVTAVALPPLPKDGGDTPRALAEALVYAALKVAPPSHGTGHPDHPSYIR
jgi:hypothetical protein